MMSGFTCGVCGKFHDELPMDIEYKYPADYLAVPSEEREERVFFSSDGCVIDDEKFIIRGVLPLPVKDNDQEFRWGLWALVDQQDFERYLELWDSPDAEEEPPFVGKLSGEMSQYPGTDLLPVTVHLQSNNLRPSFKVISDEHPLGIDQRNGITMEKVHDWFVDIQ